MEVQVEVLGPEDETYVALSVDDVTVEVLGTEE
jgi:hypothetical protein